MESEVPPPLPGRETSTLEDRRSADGTPVEEKPSGLALASVILGVLSCPFFCLTGIPGLICGVMGLRQIEASERPGAPVRYTGRNRAILGIVLSGIMAFTTPVTIGLLLPAVQAAREAARRTVCAGHGKQIALAFHNAADVNARSRRVRDMMFPLAIVDPDGRPLLSWRVALLPYLGEDALYREFHLDEPWDSPHNLALLPRMPAIYACPSSPTAGQGTTSWMAAAGPGMFLDGAEPIPGKPMIGASMAAIRDGTSNTILVLETGWKSEVPWTSPLEITASADEIADLLATGQPTHAGVRTAILGDGSVRPLPQKLDPATLRALFTRDGGETVRPF